MTNPLGLERRVSFKNRTDPYTWVRIISSEGLEKEFQIYELQIQTPIGIKKKTPVSQVEMP